MIIKERMKEIDMRISELRMERKQLEVEEARKFQKAHKNNIGRCFRTTDGEYVVIIDVPRVKNGIEHTSFNQYQFPALFIAAEEDPKGCSDLQYAPFYYDTAFTRDGVSFGNDPVFDELPWAEITPEEFRDAFANKVNAIWPQLHAILFPDKDGEKT